MASNKFLPNTLHIGRKRIPVVDLTDASNAYQIARDQYHDSDQFARGADFPEGRVIIGEQSYRISYNGRVWLDSALVMEAA